MVFDKTTGCSENPTQERETAQRETKTVLGEKEDGRSTERENSENLHCGRRDCADGYWKRFTRWESVIWAAVCRYAIYWRCCILIRCVSMPKTQNGRIAIDS